MQCGLACSSNAAGAVVGLLHCTVLHSSCLLPVHATTSDCPLLSHTHPHGQLAGV